MMKRWAFAALLATLMGINLCSAQEQDTSSIGASDDCTEISVDFRDKPNLTREEKRALMDQALRNSLNRYDRCQDAHRHAASGGGMAGTNGVAGSGMEGSNGGQGSSTASAKMKGTNSPVEEKNKPDKQHAKQSSVVNKRTQKQTKSGQTKDGQIKDGQTRGKHVLANGKLPADIPPADNDSVLEEQIRQAAIHETDPAIKVKLWNEYRRYKGLPAVNKPQAQ